MPELKHRVVTANGIRIHLVEAGKGPLVFDGPRLSGILVLVAVSA
jgi:hypothetical protein